MAASPEHYHLIVIGSGPAGEKGAVRAAYEDKKVALIERSRVLGGAAAAAGIPAKTLRETALNISGLRQRGLYGIDLHYKNKLDVQTFMYRERKVRASAEQAVVRNLEAHKVQLYTGHASFADPHTIRIDTNPGSTTLTGDVILIATGSRSVRPELFPFEHPHVYDASDILTMSRVPDSLTIVGGGIVGCEYACIFGALGLHVNLVHSRKRLFEFADREISQALERGIRELGINLVMPDRAAQVNASPDRKLIHVSLQSGQQLSSEALLVAVGRASNTDTLCLEKAGITPGKRGLIPVNEHYQTEVSHIYAAGDVIGFPALSSTSMEQGRRAVVHAFNLPNKPSDISSIPYGMWTIPEISTVGETEESAREKGIDYVVGKTRYIHNQRGLVLNDQHGFLKLIFSKKDLTLLGVHIVGQEACELIATGMLALETKATIESFLSLTFNYPSLADMYKYAAYNALGHLRGKVLVPADEPPDQGNNESRSTTPAICPTCGRSVDPEEPR
jgi:NAD(P) transhydrogenase